MLRDRLVCGINNEVIQRRLLSEGDLTFDKALKMTVAMEAAASNARDLAKATPATARTEAVNVVSKDVTTDKRAKKKPSQSGKPCYRCKKGNHEPSDCRFKTAECYKCGKVGHIKTACRSEARGPATQEKRGRRAPLNRLLTEEDQDTQREDTVGTEYNMYSCKQEVSKIDHTPAYRAELRLNGKPTVMEIDTGASLSVIGSQTYERLCKGEETLALHKTDIVLRSYSGEQIQPKGVAEVIVQSGDQQRKLPLVVVQGNQPSLLGRNWLEKLQINWREVKKLSHSTKLEALLAKHLGLFQGGLGKMKRVKARIHMKPDVMPKFHRPRPVPFALRPRVEEERQRLVEQGTIEPVRHSDWATPIMAIVKPDRTVRVCRDYKVTINQASRLEQYPYLRSRTFLGNSQGDRTSHR